jgi:hypothetical protein
VREHKFQITGHERPEAAEVATIIHFGVIRRDLHTLKLRVDPFQLRHESLLLILGTRPSHREGIVLRSLAIIMERSNVGEEFALRGPVGTAEIEDHVVALHDVEGGS